MWNFQKSSRRIFNYVITPVTLEESVTSLQMENESNIARQKAKPTSEHDSFKLLEETFVQVSAQNLPIHSSGRMKCFGSYKSLVVWMI